MRPRVLVSGITANLGGTEVVVSNYIQALHSDFAFDVISFGKPVPDAFYMWGNRVIELPHKSVDPIGYRRGLMHTFKEPSSYCAAWVNACNLVNIDVLVLSKKNNIPKRLLHAHSAQWIGIDKIKATISNINRNRISKYANLYAACSSSAGCFFFQGAPYEIINNAFDLGRFEYSNETRRTIRANLGLEKCHVIGFVGRLESEKNISFLIHLISSIKNNNKSVRLVLVGDGSKKAELERLCRDMFVEDCVIFVGQTSQPWKYYNAFDVFALPSFSEGLGLAAIEAQVNGLPCVLSIDVPEEARTSLSARRIPTEKVETWKDLLLRLNRNAFKGSPGGFAKYDISYQSEKLKALFI